MKFNANVSFFLLLLIIAGIGSYFIFKPFLMAILMAVIVYLFFRGWNESIKRALGGHKSLAALLSCLIVFLFFVVPLVAITVLVVIEAGQFYKVLQSSDIHSKFDTVTNTFLAWQFLEDFHLKSFFQSETFFSYLENIGNFFLRALRSTYQNASHFFFGIFVMFFSLYYFFKDGKAILKKMISLSPLEAREDRILLKRFATICKATLKGSLLVAIIQGFLVGLLLWATGVFSPVFLGLITIPFCFIPFFGTGIIWIPAGLIMLALGNIWQGITILVLGAVVISPVDNILKPRLIGNQSSLHPLLVFFSTLGGIAAFGIAGFIIGPVIVALFLSLLETYKIKFNS
jgi:predicted PurR-regulated permease PerM